MMIFKALLKRFPRQKPSLSLGIILCALVTGNVTAREIDHINNELESIRDRINDRSSDDIETRIRGQVSARIRQTVEDAVAESLVDSVSDTVTDGISINTQVALPPMQEPTPTEEQKPDDYRGRIITDDLPISSQTELPVDAFSNLDRLIESQLSRIDRDIGLMLDTVEDRAGNAALAGEWLVMTDEATLQDLERQGYVINHVEELAGLGFLMGTLSGPQTFNPQGIDTVQVMTDPKVVIDLNHVYLPQRDGQAEPADPSAKQASRGSGREKIGMIDSSIDRNHEVFQDSRINESIFTPRGFDKTRQHGTAIASILIGQSEHYSGISPDRRLFNGVVFATDEQGREFSTTAAIVRAINWLAENDVNLINMSLAGPDNAILRKAISSACGKGITLVTAVGNGGPAAPPLYPAAYDCTIGVTAVDDAGDPYHRAGRGSHVDYALPGINIRHARPGNNFGHSSGTSYAAAVLSGMISSLIPEQVTDHQEIRRRLSLLSADAGTEGRDPIYGQGIIRPLVRAHISK